MLEQTSYYESLQIIVLISQPYILSVRIDHLISKTAHYIYDKPPEGCILVVKICFMNIIDRK